MAFQYKYEVGTLVKCDDTDNVYKIYSRENFSIMDKHFEVYYLIDLLGNYLEQRVNVIFLYEPTVKEIHLGLKSLLNQTRATITNQSKENIEEVVLNLIKNKPNNYFTIETLFEDKNQFQSCIESLIEQNRVYLDSDLRFCINHPQSSEEFLDEYDE